MNELLLSANHLCIRAGEQFLVKNLDFSLRSGKCLGIVGESGSGKSLTSLAVMGLLPRNLVLEGEIRLGEKKLHQLPEREYRKLRGPVMAMIFQEPMTALNPTMKCGPQVAEMIRQHRLEQKTSARQQCLEWFERVELPQPDQMYHRYPHEISGGQKQRVLIAMAMACRPALLIADEPTTALDATVQKGILNLLKDLQKDHGMGLIFISHDLGVVRHVADDILVMYQGEVREYGPAGEVFSRPRDAYTRGLLACRPTPDTDFVRLPVIGDFLAGQRPRLKLRQPALRQKHLAEKLEKPPLLRLTRLDKIFTSRSGIWGKAREVAALDEVELQIHPGESLGLVGESGSGKSTLGRILCGLESATRGEVFFRDRDITRATARQWRKLHREIQIIFQDPYSSLNPRLRVGDAIAEAMVNLPRMRTGQRKARAAELLEKVGLSPEAYQRYPHEFSGGQRQRIGIARALAVQPRFIVCDESVSALDVSVQAQILNLLNDLKDEFDFTYLFISHDLAVVKYFCERIVVLKEGRVMEEGPADAIYHRPQSDYTRKLVASAF